MRIDIRATNFELTGALRAEGDARYTCEVAMAPVRMEISEAHDRLETAIDRAIDRATRVAAPLAIRDPPPPRRGGWRETRR